MSQIPSQTLTSSTAIWRMTQAPQPGNYLHHTLAQTTAVEDHLPNTIVVSDVAHLVAAFTDRFAGLRVFHDGRG